MACTFVKGSNVFYDGLSSIVIEEFHHGQGLLSYNFESAESVNGIVSEPEQTTVESYLKITCEDIEIKTVNDQKFYVNESWVAAKDLKIGDELSKFLPNELIELVPITDIEVVNEMTEVHSFNEVSDKHILFVERLMVHD